MAVNVSLGFNDKFEVREFPTTQALGFFNQKKLIDAREKQSRPYGKET